MELIENFDLFARVNQFETSSTINESFDSSISNLTFICKELDEEGDLDLGNENRQNDDEQEYQFYDALSDFESNNLNQNQSKVALFI